MPSLAGRRTRVRFVHDDEVWARVQKAITTMLAFDVVEAHHRVGKDREETFARRDSVLKTPGIRGGNGDGADVKPGVELSHPLIYKVRRGPHRQAVGVSAGHKSPPRLSCPRGPC